MSRMLEKEWDRRWSVHTSVVSIPDSSGFSYDCRDSFNHGRPRKQVEQKFIGKVYGNAGSGKKWDYPWINRI
jgi:hypothetical protein